MKRLGQVARKIGLANPQFTFIILEGAMIVIASVTLVYFHPNVVCQGSWAEANFTAWGAHKRGAVDKDDADRAVNGAGEAETAAAKIVEK